MSELAIESNKKKKEIGNPYPVEVEGETEEVEEEEEEEDLAIPNPIIESSSNESDLTPSPYGSEDKEKGKEDIGNELSEVLLEGLKSKGNGAGGGLVGGHDTTSSGAGYASAPSIDTTSTYTAIDTPTEATATTTIIPEKSFAGQKFILSGTGTEVYVTHSPSQVTSKLIILLTNSLGLDSENNLKLADEYAKKLNCPVIIPDLFDKDPIKVSGADIAELEEEEEEVAGESTNTGSSFFKNLTLSKVKAFAASTIKGFLDEMWLAKHTYERTYPKLTNTIAEIVQVYNPKSLAVIGYSFGGRYVLRLLEDQHHDEWSSEEDLIAVGASIHPSLVEEADFEVVKKPLMLIYSSEDPILSDKIIQKGIATLQDSNVNFDRHVFNEKLPHGFAVPGDYPESIVGKTPTQVIDLVSEWIHTHLP